MLLTLPMCTPRNVTGEPTSRPATEPVNMTTTGVTRVKRLLPPNKRIPITPSVSAPSTKDPTTKGLAGAIGHPGVDVGVGAASAPGIVRVMKACTVGSVQ